MKNLKLTSILGITGFVLSLWYIIAWFFNGDTSIITLIRKADNEGNDIWFVIGRYLFYVFIVLGIAGAAIPAAMGGLK